ncbi:hypothetical protein DPV78_004096 [Talaromyces pinophilus]|nr:hypothetical protein DPV78_004096 [Talaromyces pinophilus]
MYAQRPSKDDSVQAEGGCSDMNAKFECGFSCAAICSARDDSTSAANILTALSGEFRPFSGYGQENC